MLPQLSILFLLAFSSSLLFAGASQAAQNQLGYDAYDDSWTEIVSLLNLANLADKIQKTPFVSNLLHVLLTSNADEVQPEAQASPNTPESGPEFLQRSLEIFISEETGKIIRSFEAMINSTIALGMEFHDALESASSDSVSSNNTSFNPLLKKIATFVAIARDDFRARLPLPATAPGHAEREKHVSAALEYLQRLVFRLARNHEIKQEVIERHTARVRPFLHDAGVFIGDVAELYPSAIEALVLHLSTVLFPEAVFLRSLVILYCLGPYVLGKDAISGWLLKHLSEISRV